MTRNEKTVRDYYQAYVDKDRAAIEELITDDFRFTSPLDDYIDRRTYLERCWPNSEHSADFDFERIFECEDEILLTYEGRTSAGKTIRNTEFLRVRHGQVSAVEVYFGWNIPHDSDQAAKHPAVT